MTTTVGGNFPKIISRITPPATPVIVERIMIPTMSDLCSIALNAPVTAKAIVPNKSKIELILAQIVRYLTIQVKL